MNYHSYKSFEKSRKEEKQISGRVIHKINKRKCIFFLAKCKVTRNVSPQNGNKHS